MREEYKNNLRLWRKKQKKTKTKKLFSIFWSEKIYIQTIYKVFDLVYCDYFS